MDNIKTRFLKVAFASVFSAGLGACSVNLTEVNYDAKRSKLIDVLRTSKSADERRIGNSLYVDDIAKAAPKSP